MKECVCDHSWVKQNGVWTDGDEICTKCKARLEKNPRGGGFDIYGGKFYKWSKYDNDTNKRDVLTIQSKKELL